MTSDECLYCARINEFKPVLTQLVNQTKIVKDTLESRKSTSFDYVTSSTCVDELWNQLVMHVWNRDPDPEKNYGRILDDARNEWQDYYKKNMVRHWKIESTQNKKQKMNQ